MQQFPPSEMYSLDAPQGGFVMVACLILVTGLEISAKGQPEASIWHQMEGLLKDSVSQLLAAGNSEGRACHSFGCKYILHTGVAS